MLEAFLNGIIVALYGTAGLFFLKFWRRARDGLFLAFAAAFLLEGLNRVRFIFLDHPNEGTPGIYALRLVAFLVILAAIIWKNFQRRGAPGA